MNTIEKCTKCCLLSLSPLKKKKAHRRTTKSNWGITLMAMSVEVNNALLLNHIRPEVKKILWKNLNSFQRNRSTTWHILTIHRIIGGKTVVRWYLQCIRFHTQKKDGANISSICLLKETYCYNDARQKHEIISLLTDNETDFFEIATGVWQGYTFAPCLLMIVLDYVLRMSLDLIKECSYTTKHNLFLRNSHGCRLRWRLRAFRKCTYASWITDA